MYHKWTTFCFFFFAKSCDFRPNGCSGLSFIYHTVMWTRQEVEVTFHCRGVSRSNREVEQSSKNLNGSVVPVAIQRPGLRCESWIHKSKILMPVEWVIVGPPSCGITIKSSYGCLQRNDKYAFAQPLRSIFFFFLKPFNSPHLPIFFRDFNLKKFPRLIA